MRYLKRVFLRNLSVCGKVFNFHLLRQFYRLSLLSWFSPSIDKSNGQDFPLHQPWSCKFSCVSQTWERERERVFMPQQQLPHPLFHRKRREEKVDELFRVRQWRASSRQESRGETSFPWKGKHELQILSSSLQRRECEQKRKSLGTMRTLDLTFILAFFLSLVLPLFSVQLQCSVWDRESKKKEKIESERKGHLDPETTTTSSVVSPKQWTLSTVLTRNSSFSCRLKFEVKFSCPSSSFHSLPGSKRPKTATCVTEKLFRERRKSCLRCEKERSGTLLLDGQSVFKLSTKKKKLLWRQSLWRKNCYLVFVAFPWLQWLQKRSKSECPSLFPFLHLHPHHLRTPSSQSTLFVSLTLRVKESQKESRVKGTFWSGRNVLKSFDHQLLEPMMMSWVNDPSDSLSLFVIFVKTSLP